MATDFETLERVPLPCPTGVWVTDGEQLCIVEGIDPQGRYIMQDAHTSLDRDPAGRLIVLETNRVVLADVLLRRWRLVRPSEDPTTRLTREAAVARRA